MKSKDRTTTSNGSPIADIDWEAFLELQRSRESSRDSFTLNCLEDACDRLLKRPKRASAGKTLARSLIRDSRKNSRILVRQHCLLEDVHQFPAHAPNPREALELLEAEYCVDRVLNQGLALLNIRQRRAIELRFSNLPVTAAAQVLGVRQRQFRNIVSNALQFLRDQLICQSQPEDDYSSLLYFMN